MAGPSHSASQAPPEHHSHSCGHHTRRNPRLSQSPLNIPDPNNIDVDEPDTNYGNLEYVRSKGRILGWTHAPFLSWRTVLEHALEFKIESTDPCTLTERQQERHEIWSRIDEVAPLLKNYLYNVDKPIYTLAKLLQNSRNSARSADINTLKWHMPQWRNYDPPITPFDRGSMGGNNKTATRLLCPAGMNPEDPIIAQLLLSRPRAVDPAAFPRFLWKDGHVNPDDKWDGFMYGFELKCGLKHILTSPSSATSTRPDQMAVTRPGNAQIHEIQQVTPEILCYTGCLIRFVLSSQDTWSSDGIGGRFQYNRLYTYLHFALTRKLPKAQLTAMLDYYNGLLFDEIAAEEDLVSISNTSFFAEMISPDAIARHVQRGAT